MKQLIITLTAISFLAACQQPGESGGINKEQAGALTGAVAGGLLGSQIGGGTGKAIAIGAGTLLGAYMGSEVGKSLDRADMAYYHKTSQKALENTQPGETLPWQNPKSGNRGTITPQNYYKNDDGRYCREYQQTITVAGRTEQAHGTACRNTDGTWEIAN